MAIVSKAYIFSIRAIELLTQVLWLLKFLQKISRLHVRFVIDQVSQSLIRLFVHLMGQSLIHK